jgi:hypothetical protein
VPKDVSGESLLTKISNKTFPSPIMLGVTVKDNAASLNSICCFTIHYYRIWYFSSLNNPWLPGYLRVNTLGEETILVVPNDSNASSSIFKAADEKCFYYSNSAGRRGYSLISVPVPAAAAPRAIAPGVVAAPPIIPDWTLSVEPSFYH